MPKQIMHTTEKGSSVEFIDSLNDLKGYSVETIEKGPSETYSTTVILRKNGDIIRIWDKAYQSLKQEYINSGNKEDNVESLIDSIDKALNSI